MTDPDAPLDLAPLRNAIEALDSAIGYVSDAEWYGRQPATLQNTLLAGAIQSFEFVFELSFRMLKRQLIRREDSPDRINHSSFRDILRIGGEAGLVDDVEAWFRYRDLRNRSAHTYDQAKARDLFRDLKPFLADARSLLARLDAYNV